MVLLMMNGYKFTKEINRVPPSAKMYMERDNNH